MKKYFLIGPIVIFILWILISYLNIIDSFFLPSPISVFIELLSLFISREIFIDIFITLIRTIEAFLIAVIIGVPLGLFLGESEKIYKSFEFVIDFFRSTPATAMFPLFLLIFGISDSSKIAVAAFGAVLIILFNTAYGVFNSKKLRILSAKIMGASKFQIFKWITLYESLPQTFIGLRNSISVALVIIVITEMFIGSNIGLGHRIIDFQMVYNIKAMYATIILTGVVGYLLNFCLMFLERKIVHWRGN